MNRSFCPYHKLIVVLSVCSSAVSVTLQGSDASPATSSGAAPVATPSSGASADPFAGNFANFGDVAAAPEPARPTHTPAKKSADEILRLFDTQVPAWLRT